jgi:hypothetical protein
MYTEVLNMGKVLEEGSRNITGYILKEIVLFYHLIYFKFSSIDSIIIFISFKEKTYMKHTCYGQHCDNFS